VFAKYVYQTAVWFTPPHSYYYGTSRKSLRKTTNQEIIGYFKTYFNTESHCYPSSVMMSSNGHYKFDLINEIEILIGLF
jgi:hypothetical protein